MKMRHVILIAILALFGCATPMRTEDLRATMEADNARWLAAFNKPNSAAFPAMYNKDAILLPPGEQPVTEVHEANRQFWVGGIMRRVRHLPHVFDDPRVDVR